MKARVIVSVVIEKDGKVLLGKKTDGIGPYPNTWRFIGGGVNLEEESVSDALKRETKEEAGIEIENITLLEVNEDYQKDKHGDMVHYLFLTYTAVYVSGEITPGDDIVTIQVFTKEELPHINLAATKGTLKKAGYLV
jgi:ADP-ribose pyrophosphatase YjhB (NUDIX family)